MVGHLLRIGRIPGYGFRHVLGYPNVVERVIDRHIESPPSPDAPDAFRFARPGKLRDVLVAAGAIAPFEHLLQFTIPTALSAEDFWTLRCELSERPQESLPC